MHNTHHTSVTVYIIEYIDKLCFLYSPSSLSRLGSLDSAIEAYSQAVTQDPMFLEAYVGRGNVYMDFLTEEGFSKSKYVYIQLYMFMLATM